VRIIKLENTAARRKITAKETTEKEP